MSSFISQQWLEKPTMETYLFGCELSAKTKQYTFKVDDEDDCEHCLSLQTLSLGADAKDEYNVVEVTARNHENKEITVPLANLKLSCLTMLNMDFEIQPPVTFRLKSGSGPVLVSGRHIIVSSGDNSENDESLEEEDDVDDDDNEENDEEITPVKPAKKNSTK